MSVLPFFPLQTIFISPLGKVFLQLVHLAVAATAVAVFVEAVAWLDSGFPFSLPCLVASGSALALLAFVVARSLSLLGASAVFALGIALSSFPTGLAALVCFFPSVQLTGGFVGAFTTAAGGFGAIGTGTSLDWYRDKPRLLHTDKTYTDTMPLLWPMHLSKHGFRYSRWSVGLSTVPVPINLFLGQATPHGPDNQHNDTQLSHHIPYRLPSELS